MPIKGDFVDELDKKARGAGWDPLAVTNKDPGMHYRWLNKSKLNMARKTQYLGYEVCHGEEHSVLGDNTPLKKGSDTTTAVELGDLVLAKIPKELHERYRRDNEQKIKRRTMAAAEAAKHAIDRIAGSRVAYEEHTDASDMRDSPRED